MDTVACGVSGSSDGWLPRVHVHLDYNDSAPRVSRQAIASCLRADGLDEGSVDLALLGVSELVSNALVHGAPPCTLQLLTRLDRFRVEVEDASRAVPVPVPSTALITGGRGLVLLDALSAGWGYTLGATGKTVWFEGPSGPGA